MKSEGIHHNPEEACWEVWVKYEDNVIMVRQTFRTKGGAARRYHAAKEQIAAGLFPRPRPVSEAPVTLNKVMDFSVTPPYHERGVIFKTAHSMHRVGKRWVIKNNHEPIKTTNTMEEALQECMRTRS